VEAKDAPDTVQTILPGLQHLFSLTIEPIAAPKAARDLALKTARQIAQACEGLVFDPQLDEIVFPEQVEPTPKVAQSEAPYRHHQLQLSWYFDSEALQSVEGIRRFLDLLEALLPQALPHRYDTTEPRQFSLKKDGPGHFANFVLANPNETICWDGKAPVEEVYLLPKSQHRQTKDFFPTSLRIHVAARALQQPGVEDRLKRLWKEMALFLRPFYGEARTIGGHLVIDKVYHPDDETIHPPLHGGWYGMPPSLGHAVVVGPPYVPCWPELQQHTLCHEGLHFASVERWQGQNILPFTPPEALWEVDLKPHEWAGGRLYPVVWPFGEVERVTVSIVPDGLDWMWSRDAWERHPFWKSTRETLTRELSEFIVQFNADSSTPLDLFEFHGCESLSPRQVRLIEEWLPKVSDESRELLLRVLLQSGVKSMRGAPLTAVYDATADLGIQSRIEHLLERAKITGVEDWLIVKLRNAEAGSTDLSLLYAVPKQLPRASAQDLLKELYPKAPSYVAKLIARTATNENLTFLEARKAEQPSDGELVKELEKAIARIAKRLGSA
jgi:hypothetical protein